MDVRVTDLSLVAGGYDGRLRENVEYLEELKRFAVENKVANRVRFVTSCSTAERNAFLSECLCVLYTPKVWISPAFSLQFFFFLILILNGKKKKIA